MINRVEGTSGNDLVFATSSSDLVLGLGGSDAVHGDAAKDIFVVDPQQIILAIQDFEDGSDLIDLSQLGVTSFEQLQIEYQSGDGYNKAIIHVDGWPVTIYIQPMNPAIAPEFGPTDFIYAGTPIYDYSTGFDSVTVSANEYAVHMGNGGTNWLNLNALVRGSETATAGALVVMDDGDQGNGTFTVKGVTQHFFDFQNVRGTNGRDEIHGDGQNNNLVGLSNADVLHGGDGDDRIFGNSGADRLFGDDGDDVLNGGAGRDLLTGGEGQDSFVFVAYDNRRDIVFDYEDGTDRLDISQWGASSVDDLTITQLSGGRVLVALPDTALSFELRSEDGPLTVADLDNSDFIFI